ncbi:MAG: DUF1018 domain-containing protein [Desulfobulbaceae bacterium]|nr:DUF1018 domain-containing protein [Desulfobulbaceae bacterium]HIJ79156.1 DUF1018 domain-containing protein [Deltaproteobacteria bacterium]
MIDHKKLAVIHIVKKELGLSDSQYRDTLEKITGVRSAKDLDDQSFHKLMRYFTRSKHYRQNKNSITFRQKMYLKHLQNDLAWDDSHFTNFLHKYYKTDKIDSLTKPEAGKVIESLKHILAHKKIDSH